MPFRLTNAGEYAVRLMTYLAGQPPEKVVSAKEVATAQDIPHKFLQTIVSQFVKQGFVQSFKGVNGGIQLAPAAREMTLLQVIEAIEGPIARNIIMFGWGNKTLPVQTPTSSWYRPNPRYDLFLDNGNRLALIDQDWFYGHGQPAEPVFGPGDFAYDYFGLTGAVNDPVSGADTLFTGAGVTPVDSAFVTNPYRLTHAVYGTDNWGDYLIPGTATPIFTGVNDDNCYGVINTDGNFHTVFLPFMADAAVDTLPDGTVVSPQFTQLLHGIINWFDVVGATTPEQIQPKEFSLSPNFPNPFNPTTRINFTVPASGKVSIAIYNLLGQKVNQLVNGAFQSGSYSVVWNGRDGNGQQLATGIYLYRMEAVEFSQTRKLVLLK